MSRIETFGTCLEGVADSSRLGAGARALIHDAYDWFTGLKSPPVSDILHARAFDSELWRAAREPRRTLIEEFSRVDGEELPWNSWQTSGASSFHALDRGHSENRELGSIGISRLRDGTHTLTSFGRPPEDWSVHIARGGRLQSASDLSARGFNLSEPKFVDVTAFLSPENRNPSLFHTFNRGRSIPVPSDAVIELRLPGGLVRRAISTPATGRE